MKSLKMTLALLSVVAFGLAGSATTKTKREAGDPVAPASSSQSAAASISNFKFEPKALRVKVGTTVTWTNTDGTHPAVADGQSFESPTLAKGQTFSHKFAKRGKYPYYCSFHGGEGGEDMAGTIIVVP